MANSIDTSTSVAATALDNSNDKISAILGDTTLAQSPGKLMAALTNQQAVSSAAQGAMNKIKDEVKAVAGFGR
jgi:hypothetical protein